MANTTNTSIVPKPLEDLETILQYDTKIKVAGWCSYRPELLLLV
jgi:hypothetical protein